MRCIALPWTDANRLRPAPRLHRRLGRKRRLRRRPRPKVPHLPQGRLLVHQPLQNSSATPPPRPPTRSPQPPRATDPQLAAMIVKAKRNAPLSSPKKIIPTLREAHPDLTWPAPSTASAILSPRGPRRSAASAPAACLPTPIPSPTSKPSTTAEDSPSRQGPSYSPALRVNVHQLQVGPNAAAPSAGNDDAEARR